MRLAELSPIGERVTLDTLHFSAEDIIRFARDFDPQPFHLDAEAAKTAFSAHFAHLDGTLVQAG